MKHRSIVKTWLRRFGYLAVAIIAVLWLRNFVGICKQSAEALAAPTRVCSVEEPLRAKHMRNGEIVVDATGKELVRISTVQEFPEGYVDILYTLDTSADITSEDVSIQGYEGTYYRVPVVRKVEDDLMATGVSEVMGHTYYVLLRNNSGEDCYMMGTALSKEKLLPLFDVITLRAE